MEVNIKATLEERISKDNKKYLVLVMKLTDSYEKLIFLDKAEIELLKIKSKNAFIK